MATDEKRVNVKNLGKNLLEMGMYVAGMGILTFGVIKALDMFIWTGEVTTAQILFVAGIAGAGYGLAVYFDMGKRREVIQKKGNNNDRD